jgi:predicted RecB family nuclease
MRAPQNPLPLVYPCTMITSHHITQFTLCPTALYLDHHGPFNEKSDPHPFLEYLQQLGNDHEAAIAAQMPHSPISTEASIPQRANSTLTLMKQGIERLYQPVLLSPPLLGMKGLPSKEGLLGINSLLGINGLLGIPDFLELDSSTSPPSYRPVDVKIASSPKPQHLLQLAFYGLLLGHTMGHIPETGDLILENGSRETIALHDHLPEVERAIQEIVEIQNGREEFPTLSSECGMCPWNDHCLQILQANSDLSLLNGLSRGRKGALNGAGYFDLDDIAQADPEALCEVRGIGEITAERMVLQASVLLQNEPQFLSDPELPQRKTELYLDMECQQGSQVIYLIGVLECRNGEEEFKPFVAECPDDEERMWESFLNYLNSLPDDITIYHYHHFESTHLRKLAERYGMKKEQEDKLFDNLIDLHSLLKQAAVLPVYSYGLKSVAKWMGFEWRKQAQMQL